ncbi:hypothetical protein Q0601_16605 [Paracoccus onubensis]|uniref:hypothetical protein n=1 Tax=Paracoccus onubensis TaxID=1675788 RepID=UPI00272FA554|nr:hypothetical protein [Paracoccus onubensis]MDP0928806.1 hypothetical protein [Paracoccus onubensis]
MTRFARYALCATLPLLSACNGQPGDYPSLLPMDQLLAEPELPAANIDPAVASDTARSRADDLGARADALRGPVIEPDLRRRIEGTEG